MFEKRRRKRQRSRATGIAGKRKEGGRIGES